MFLSLYDFFQKQKYLFWGVFISTLIFFIYTASRIHFKEDIADLLPNNKAVKAMNNVLSHTQAGEQILFLTSLKDSSIVNPDSVIAATEAFNTLLQKNCSQWIDSINLQVGEGMQEELITIIQNNLPLFLNETEFKALDSLISFEHIDKTLASNRKILMSPAGIVFKKFVAADPIGIANQVWKKMANLKFDTSFEIYNGYLFSHQNQKLTFLVKPKYKASETGKNAPFFAALDQTIATWEKDNKGVHLIYFGGPAVAVGNALQMRSDTILTLSLTLLLLLALFFYYFKNKRTPFLLLIPVIYGAAMGLAVLYWVQGSISVIALGAGAIVLGIAIDYAVHFLSHTKHTHVRTTIKELQQPLTLGSFTTIAAFFSLRFVQANILKDLGLFAAICLVGSALCTLIFLPHFITNKEPVTAEKATIFDRLGAWQPEKNKLLLWGILLFTPIMLYFSFEVRFDSDLMHLNFLSGKMKNAQEEVMKSNTFAMSSIFLVAHETKDTTALQHLEFVQNEINQLQSENLIRSISNPCLLISSEGEQEKRIHRWQEFWTKDRKINVINNIRKAAIHNGYNPLAFTKFEDLLAHQQTLFDPSTTQQLKSFFPSGFSADSSNQYAVIALKVAPENRKKIFDAFQNQQEVIVTDKQQAAHELVNILNKDFQNIALYSSLIVFIALLIGYGRIELALISFLPMAISWIWILGLMALFHIPFNIVNIIVSTLIFGLGDDYSIFTMDGLIEKYKLGTPKLNAVRTAVYVSVATVLIGLGVLLLAQHPALKSIAFISVTGMLCVLLISQTIQPFLFNFLVQSRADKGFMPFTLWSLLKSIFAFSYFFIGSFLLVLLGVLFTKIWPFNKEKGKYLFHYCVSKATKSMMYIMTNTQKKIVNGALADFSKPAIYIANHTSFLDILMTTMLHPKLVLLTNKWVWKSPVFGAVVRMAEYYPVAEGAEDSIAPLNNLVQRGYSVLVFPEGTRSPTDKINRFHKGAFFLTEKMKLDLVPITLHGVHYTMQKGDWLLKDGCCSVYFHNRISAEQIEFGANYATKAKEIGAFMRNDLAQIKVINETPSYFKEQLIRSYTFKGPVLEWYCKIKIRLENYYEPIHEILPRNGLFYDLGCGYGFMAYMLHWAAPERSFIGIDYDEEKIAVAQNNYKKTAQINFIAANLIDVKMNPCNGILITDVLHYLLPQQQTDLLEKAINALLPNGILIIRDGIKDLKTKHSHTVWTEIFSTKIFGFNKTQNKLHFIDQKMIENFANKFNLEIEILEREKRTSNLIFILKKKG